MTRPLMLIFLAASLVFTACTGDEKIRKKPVELDINDALKQFKECKENATEKFACKEFTSKALNGHYLISDFYHPEEENAYLPVDEIFDMVEKSDDWVKLGDATDQKALDDAQKAANDNRATIAVSTKKGARHVAIIIKGDQAKSNSWGGLKCPNSASFFQNRPDDSYVGKTLNYAWSKPADIALYARKK